MPRSSGGRGGDDDDDGQDDDDDDDQDDDDDAVEVDGLDIAVELPFIVDAFGDDVFPTYLAHLMGTSFDPAYLDPYLACVEIENTGNTAREVRVEVDLTGYSEPDSALLDLEPGESDEVCLAPTPDLGDLYDLSSGTSTSVAVEVTDADGGDVIYDQADSIFVSSPNDVFWLMNGEPAFESVAALVRPHASEVEAVLDDIVEYSWFDGSIGVGGYRADNGTTWRPWDSWDLDAGDCFYWSIYAEDGETFAISAQSDGQDSIAYLADPANLAAALAGNEWYAVWDSNIQSQQSYTYTATDAGWHGVVVCNNSSIFDEEVYYTWTMTRADNVLDYLQMIFEFLRDDGINYVNVPGSFFENAQHVLLPDEVLSNGGGNCIDGTLLFASLLELIGVRPAIVVVPGHAFVAVASAPGGPGDPPGTLWPLETTMVGGEASFWEALQVGVQDINTDDLVAVVAVDAARAADIAPMP